MAIDHIITEHGSVYKYLPDGRTQRHNKIKDKLYEPQDILVFVPPYAWVLEHAPERIKPEIPEILGNTPEEYSRTISTYIMAPGKKAFVVDGEGKKMTSNAEVSDAERVFLALWDGVSVRIAIPLEKKPAIGYFTFDTRKFENGTRRESHLGNKVIAIVES